MTYYMRKRDRWLVVWAPLASLLIMTAHAASTEREPRTGAPAASSAIAKVALINPGFESDTRRADGGAEGWSGTQHAGEMSYRFTLDPAIKRSGTRSMRVDNVGSEPYGAIEQAVSVASLAGRKVRFSGWLKTRGADGVGASLMMLVDGSGGILTNNFMAGSEATGSREWQRYSITLGIPTNASGLRVGVMLQGAGTVWFDDAELEIIGP